MVKNWNADLYEKGKPPQALMELYRKTCSKVCEVPLDLFEKIKSEDHFS